MRNELLSLIQVTVISCTAEEENQPAAKKSWHHSLRYFNTHVQIVNIMGLTETSETVQYKTLDQSRF